MNNPAPNRALFGKSFNLSHQVMLDFGLDLVSPLDVNLVGMRPQVINLGLADQSGGLLRLGQGYP
jgi:hypothetical protein